MELLEIAASARHAVALLSDFPLTWLVLVLVFLAVVEGLMFVPYVGFLAKLSVASLLAAQVLVLFDAASQGAAPRVGHLAGALDLPLSAQIVLIATGLIPFFIGIAYLAARGGFASVRFFFGNILEAAPPEPRRYFAFKSIMHVTVLPFTFVAAAVTLKGHSGWEALAHGLSAAAVNWPALLVLLLVSLLFEWALESLSSLLPRLAATALASMVLIAFVAWSFAFVYALSVRALPDMAPIGLLQ